MGLLAARFAEFAGLAVAGDTDGSSHAETQSRRVAEAGVSSGWIRELSGGADFHFFLWLFRV
jgi:hypothetical protein